MDMKSKIIFFVGVICIILFLLLILLNRTMHKKTHSQYQMQGTEKTELSVNDYQQQPTYIENQVVCIVESKETAESVAREVGGELLSYQDGVAVIGIVEKVKEFLNKYEGRTDLPVMQPNYIYNSAE